MYPYGIGLDIGITSVGWSVVALDGQERPCGILNMGTRIFDAAEHPKTGDSLAAPRREARSARRRLRRHKHRNERIRQLLLARKIVTDDELVHLFDGHLEDIYTLRVRALDEVISSMEFARILLHISQRRGFRSNRKNDASTEEGELLSRVQHNRTVMLEKGYRTVAELYLKDAAYHDHKRNKGGNYTATVGRDMIEDEVHQIFEAQRRFGATFAAEDVESAYLEILLSQRSFDEGPGGNSPYSGSQIEKMVGRCTFEPEEPRAAKASYSFEYFNLLEKINHIRVLENGHSIPLTSEQRQCLVALAHKTADLTYAKIRKELSLTETQTFNMVHYMDGAPLETAEKKEKFCYLKAYHQMRKAFDKVSKGYFDHLTVLQRNEIGRVLSLYKTEENIRKNLSAIGLSMEDIKIAESIGTFSRFGHLSVKACEKIIPFLEKGMTYSDACTAAGYQFKGHDDAKKDRLLHLAPEVLENVTSPVVRRAVSQTVKVMNAIIRERGYAPTYVNIELAREMSKDFAERKKIEKENKENQARNERLLERIRNEFGKSDPTGLDLVKLKLYEEQGGVCAYSLKQMSLEHLFDADYTEVDHIIPYSISFDDSYKNKVLVLTKENRNKGNRLPLQYLTGKQREDFIVWANACVRNSRKRQNLLKERISEEDEKKFKERNLQDTKTISRFLLNFINDTLEFAPSSRRKKRVTAVNGAVTSHLRRRWGITKIRENGDLHHAVDALVIACTTDGMIQQISKYTMWRECRYTPLEEASIAVDEATGEVISKFPYPWPDFRKELEARLSSDPRATTRQLSFYVNNPEAVVRPLFVSRAPKRKISGAAHKETIKSPVAIGAGLVVAKHSLTDLKLNKDGEIANYYMPHSDRLLYEALKVQLKRFGGDGKKAFTEPFHKPKSDGTPGPVVNKVKLCEPSTLNVSVHNGMGVADNDSMIRIDVFHVENDGYYFVPIYVADTLKPELPCKACVAHKPYSGWKAMRNEDFIFSLYPNDLIKIVHKSGINMALKNKDSTLLSQVTVKEQMFYYTAANISSGAIALKTHDGAYEAHLGIKTLEKVEKFTVDVLGEYHKIDKETRQPFKRKRG